VAAVATLSQLVLCGNYNLRISPGHLKPWGLRGRLCVGCDVADKTVSPKIRDRNLALVCARVSAEARRAACGSDGRLWLVIKSRDKHASHAESISMYVATFRRFFLSP
jgi:hypothetical protein